MANKKVKKILESVYYVESPNDNTVLLAINLKTDGRLISWFDTVKNRVMRVEKIIDENPKHFSFKRSVEEGGAIYTFLPITISLYNQKVKDRLLVSRKFTKKEDLTRALLDTLKDAW